MRQRRGLFVASAATRCRRSSAAPGVDAERDPRSADVRAHGWLASVRVQTASGDVTVGPLPRRCVQSASGDVTTNEALDDLSVQTASGDVRIGRVARQLSIQGVSGDVRVATADGAARVTLVRATSTSSRSPPATSR